MTYEAEVLADTPLGYWRLGEPSGTTATDLGSGATDGVYENSPTLGVTGLLAADANTAVQFAAGTDRMRTAVAGVYSDQTLTPGAALEAVVKVTTLTASTFRLVGVGTDSNVALQLNLISGRFKFQYNGPSPTFSGHATATGPIAVAGTTYHVVGRFNPATACSELYVDGVLVASGVVNAEAPFLPASSRARVGQYVGGTSGGQNIVIDEPAVYYADLSAARILTHSITALNRATYTPPIATDMGPIIPDTRGLQRLLFRHYSPHGRFQTVWKLNTTPITYSLTQPYPLITPQDVAQGNMPIGQTYTEATYLHVYYGPELVDEAEAARLEASGIGTVT